MSPPSHRPIHTSDSYSQGSTPYIPDFVNPELLYFETALRSSTSLRSIYQSLHFSQQQYRYHIPSLLVLLFVLFPRAQKTKGKLFPIRCHARKLWRVNGSSDFKGLEGIRAALLLSKQCSMATDHRDSFAFLGLVPPFGGHGDTGLWHFLVI